MQVLKKLILTLLLIVTPALQCTPLEFLNPSLVQKFYEKTKRSLTYDEILHILDNIESGSLEKQYTEQQLEEVSQFVTFLAHEGILPDDTEYNEVLEEDINELLEGEENRLEYAFHAGNYDECFIMPALYTSHSYYNLHHCGWVSKKWKKTKKFVKKHKKAIIIGAVVVVAVTAVTVAVVSSAGAAKAAAGAGAAAGAAKTKQKKPSKTPPPAQTDFVSSPETKKIVDDQVAEFKEFIAEDKQSEPSQKWEDLSFGEKARELGAHLAHEIYDELAELGQFIPQLCEEINEIGAKLVPEDLKLPSSHSPTENYNELVAAGHSAIDTSFATDQADLFTPGGKACDPKSQFNIGIIPLPNEIPSLFSNTEKLLQAGNAVDRAGFTKVGRGLMKHGYRQGGLFPKPTGNPAQINKKGENTLKAILHDPNRQVVKNKKGGIEIYASNGQGAYFRHDGTFRGFIEYGHK